MSFRARLAARQAGREVTRVAVVLSGQARTWRDCLPWWTTMFTDHGPVSLDIFVHLWNFNTVGHGVHSEKVPLDRQELLDLTSILKPKKLLIEGPDVNPRAIMAKHRRPEDVDGSMCEWQASQFYSTMRAGHLKRVHEIDQGFDYDVCVKGRLDMVFPDQTPLPRTPLPDRHTLYSIHSGFDWRWQRERTGDIFYYSDSPTFDIAANFFRHLWRFGIQEYTFQGNMMPPEMAFHDYMVGIMGVTEHRLPWGPKLKRPADYADILKAEGRTLGEHETF